MVINTMEPAHAAGSNGTSPGHKLKSIACATRVKFKWWGTKRTLDKSQKQLAADAFDADGGMISAGKKLIDTAHPRVRALTETKGRIQDYWHSLTLPYVEDGVRLLRKSDLDEFDQRMKSFREDLQEAAHALQQSRWELIEQAKDRLKKLFCAADYPPDLSQFFSVEWDYPSLQPPNYLKDLSPEVYEQEQQRIAARFDEAVRLAEDAFAQELADTVAHLADALAVGEDGKPKVFRDSAVNNIKEFFDRFKTLSIGSNAQLDQIVEEAKQVIAGVTPGQLRQGKGLREEIRTSMQQIEQKIQQQMQARPRRKLLKGGVR